MDQVVCIYDRWINHNRLALSAWPVKGGIYTIQESVTHPETGHVYHQLYEIPDVIGGDAVTFRADCFRPVRRTSIDDIKKAALPVRATEKADA